MLFVLQLFVTVCAELNLVVYFESSWFMLLVFVGICRATWSSVWDLIPAHRAIGLFGTGWPHDSRMESSSESMLQIVNLWSILKNEERTEAYRDISFYKYNQKMSTQCTNFASNHLHTTSRRWPCSPRFVSSTRGLKTSEETLLPLESADWFLFSFRDGSRKVYGLLWCLLATSVGRLQHYFCVNTGQHFSVLQKSRQKKIFDILCTWVMGILPFFGPVVIVTWCSSKGPVTQDGKIHHAFYRAHSVQFNRITISYYFLAP